MTLNLPNDAVIQSIKNVVGVEYVWGKDQDLSSFGRDYTEDFQFHPEWVVFPGSSAEVAAVLKICNESQIPLFTRGAGTGLSGGALPVKPGIVLSTSRLNKILHIDTQNYQATVEPGVINQHFRNEVEAHGLFYPPDPASLGSCFLGGNIAHGSGGPKAVKYGTTKDYVLNLEVALPNGEIIWTGANTVKNSTGFNLTQLMVGSEGLLGVVTKIVFKLVPLPQKKVLMLVPFEHAQDAAASVNKVFEMGVIPSALELMEKSGVEYAMQHTGAPFPTHPSAQFYLLLELDGNDLDQLMTEAESIYPGLESLNALDVMLADSSEQQDKWWKIRRSIGEAVKLGAIYKEEDTVVPRFALPELLVGVKEIGKKYGFESVCYGHAGDGNLHVNILKKNISDEKWENEVPKGIREIFKLCKKLGGTISGEHGIGLVQKPYLDIVFSNTHFEIMRGIKKAFDPKGILNPGKWLDKE